MIIEYCGPDGFTSDLMYLFCATVEAYGSWNFDYIDPGSFITGNFMAFALTLF